MIQETVLSQALQDLFGQIQFQAEPAGLYDPLRYMIAIGGKRLRPRLCLLTYGIYQDTLGPHILEPAAGLEVFHTFTLIHDDIMDHSPLRRGHQTHVRRRERHRHGRVGNLQHRLGDFRRLARVGMFCALPHNRRAGGHGHGEGKRLAQCCRDSRLIFGGLHGLFIDGRFLDDRSFFHDDGSFLHDSGDLFLELVWGLLFYRSLFLDFGWGLLRDSGVLLFYRSLFLIIFYVFFFLVRLLLRGLLLLLRLLNGLLFLFRLLDGIFLRRLFILLL